MKILESYTRLAKSLFVEEDVKDKKIKFKDKDGNDKEATVGGILKKGEKHPAYDDAKAMMDKGKDGEKEEPSGKLGAGDFERDSDDSEPEDKPFGGDTGKDADYGGGDFTKSADYDMWSDDEPKGDDKPSGEPSNPSGKKERDHEPEEGPTLENHEKYYVHENENSKIIGTLHKPQKPNYDDYDDENKYKKDLEIYKKENAKFMDFYEETVKKEVEAFLNKHGAENVVFMPEGGDEGDNYKEGSEQHMVADHVKGQGGTVDTFDGPEMSQWVNQEGSKDENGDDLFDRLSKNSKPPKTRSQSAAGIYAFMVGQGDDGGDAMEYMDKRSGVDQKEAEQYLKDNGYVGSIPPKNKSEKRHLYLLAFPGDASEKEKKKYNIKEPNGVSEVEEIHNKARQNNMIKKKEHYENSDPPKKVLVVPGASHAFEMRDEFLEKKKEERFSIEAAKKGFKAQSIPKSPESWFGDDESGLKTYGHEGAPESISDVQDLISLATPTGKWFNKTMDGVESGRIKKMSQSVLDSIKKVAANPKVHSSGPEGEAMIIKYFEDKIESGDIEIVKGEPKAEPKKKRKAIGTTRSIGYRGSNY